MENFDALGDLRLAKVKREAAKKRREVMAASGEFMRETTLTRAQQMRSELETAREMYPTADLRSAEAMVEIAEALEGALSGALEEWT